MSLLAPTARAPGFIRGNPQLTRAGELKHLLSIEGLPRALLTRILDTATLYAGDGHEDGKRPLLQGKCVHTLFCEASVRTRRACETAARRLSADVLSLDLEAMPGRQSELSPGTLAHLGASQADLLVVRHAQSGAPYLIAEHCAPHVHVINAGDGQHAQPVRGLLDMYAIRHYKPDIRALTVAIVGDILHSRVARSDIHALTTLGAPEIRAIGPATLLPDGLEQLGVKVFHDMDEGLRGVDVIVMLRLQDTWMNGALLPSGQAYFRHYGLTPERLALAAPDAIVVHPGPMNCGVEIESSLADALEPVMLEQADFGIAVCMAVMGMMAAT